jgi:hypothetical protein
VTQSRYITLAEAAVCIRKIENAVKRLRDREQIPFIQMAHSIMFDRQQLNEWVAGLRKMTAEEAIQRIKGYTTHPAVLRILAKEQAAMGDEVVEAEVPMARAQGLETHPAVVRALQHLQARRRRS